MAKKRVKANKETPHVTAREYADLFSMSSRDRFVIAKKYLDLSERKQSIEWAREFKKIHLIDEIPKDLLAKE